MTKITRSAIPRKNSPAADKVMTPDYLAQEIVNHFRPQGSALDPCAGKGVFVEAMKKYSSEAEVSLQVFSMEIDEGRDFLHNYRPVYSLNFIISNPPYSILRPFLQNSYKVADNIVYLVQQPRPFFKALMEDAEAAGFGLKECYRVKVPSEWRKDMSPFGGGYCAAHWQRGWDHSKHGTLFTGANSDD